MCGVGCWGESRGGRADGALGVCAYGPLAGFPVVKGRLEVYKMAARELHPRLDSPTFVLACSGGNRAFGSDKRRWRLKLLLRSNAQSFAFHMSASWLSLPADVAHALECV